MLRIFSPFFKIRDGAMGAGLGLPFVADVSRRGGGDRPVATEPGCWTRSAMPVPINLSPGSEEVLTERLGPETTAAPVRLTLLRPPDG